MNPPTACPKSQSYVYPNHSPSLTAAGASVPESVLIGLLGVGFGAIASFIVTTVNETLKHRRELAIRWDTRTYDVYLLYLRSVVLMARIAGQLAATYGWDEIAYPIEKDEGLAQLNDAERERTANFEGVVLLGDSACIRAGNDLNKAVWRIEWLARQAAEGSSEEWLANVSLFVQALQGFQGCARKGLALRGIFPKERIVERPERSQKDISNPNE